MSKLDKLFILPFDHRNSFLKKMFNVSNRDATPQEDALVIEYKGIIYQGFKKVINDGLIDKESAAILIDEQFGDAIIRDAVNNEFQVCLSTEKSGQDEYAFEYGNDFKDHINKYRPTFVKALVRYNPDGDQKLNQRQRSRLKELSDFCLANDYGFLIEPLVPATAEQLASVENNQARYDNELRPALMVTMVKEMHADGIEPLIWKIEGLENQADYKKIVAAIQEDDRIKAKAIVLGRGASDTQVEAWLKAGAGVAGVIGFAVGRTIFWEPLVDYKEGRINKTQAAQKIGERFYHFYQIFTS